MSKLNFKQLTACQLKGREAESPRKPINYLTEGAEMETLRCLNGARAWRSNVFFCAGAPHRTEAHNATQYNHTSLSLSLSIYIYIYDMLL